MNTALKNALCSRVDLRRRSASQGYSPQGVFHDRVSRGEGDPDLGADKGNHHRGLCLFLCSHRDPRCLTLVTPAAALRYHQCRRTVAAIIPACPLPSALPAICLSLLTSKQHKHCPSRRSAHACKTCTCSPLALPQKQKKENHFLPQFKRNYKLSARQAFWDDYLAGMRCNPLPIFSIFAFSLLIPA